MLLTGGWVPLKQGENVKYTKAIIGNTYVIWTWDNHYAKVRVKTLLSERVVFDWAYQLVEGNRELKRGNVSTERKEFPKDGCKENINLDAFLLLVEKAVSEVIKLI